MRSHLIMNAHRLTTFSDIKAEGTNVKQAQSADGRDGRRNGCRLVVERIAPRSFQRFWKGHEFQGCLLVLREKGTPSVRVPQETERWWQEKVEG